MVKFQPNNQLINILKTDCLNMTINHLHYLKYFFSNFLIMTLFVDT